MTWSIKYGGTNTEVATQLTAKTALEAGAVAPAEIAAFDRAKGFILADLAYAPTTEAPNPKVDVAASGHTDDDKSHTTISVSWRR